MTMKTTIDIDSHLLAEARRLASRDETTLRSLIEEGLRQIVNERSQSPKFQLRPASFGGNGLRPEHEAGEWGTIRALAYQDRGR